MNSNKLSPRLEKLFWFIGWATLIVAAIGWGTALYIQSTINFESATHGIPAWSDTFNFLPQLKILIMEVTDAFFAFLIATVFGALSKRRPVGLERGRRFLLITCAGFALQAVISFASWIAFLIHVRNYECSGAQCEFLFQLLTKVSTFASVLSSLSPLLYALTIYVLFQHFTRLVTFESEVV